MSKLSFRVALILLIATASAPGVSCQPAAGAAPGRSAEKTSYQAYEGIKRPPGQVAILTLGIYGGNLLDNGRLIPEALDGRDPTYNYDGSLRSGCTMKKGNQLRCKKISTIELLPGTHTIRVWEMGVIMMSGPGCTPHAGCILTTEFTVEAGKFYSLDADFADAKSKFTFVGHYGVYGVTTDQGNLRLEVTEISPASHSGRHVH